MKQHKYPPTGERLNKIRYVYATQYDVKWKSKSLKNI